MERNWTDHDIDVAYERGRRDGIRQDREEAARAAGRIASEVCVGDNPYFVAGKIVAAIAALPDPAPGQERERP